MDVSFYHSFQTSWTSGNTQYFFNLDYDGLALWRYDGSSAPQFVRAATDEEARAYGNIEWQ